MMNSQHLDQNFNGLTDAQVEASRAAHGPNKIEGVKHNSVLDALKDALQEPMLVLLGVASFVYVLHGDLAEATFLFVAIILVYSISHFQKSRSESALKELKKLSQPKCNVIRNGKIEEIYSEDIVTDDVIVIEEGSLIPADGVILQSNDFSVNESILTGESLSVEKNESRDYNLVFQGTLVVSGRAICQVRAIGNETQVAKIGKSIEDIKDEKSPLQLQITRFVKKMAAVGIVIFLVMWAFSIYKTHSISGSLLNSLTLAMSILPEEIPVAFATFMALGAWRLIQLGIIVKDIQTVETLGSATVICVDKTGTITTNEMALDRVYVFRTDAIVSNLDSREIEDVITTAMWASEPVPFDQMEKVLHAVYSKITTQDVRSDYALVKEYPLSGKPPFMTHVFQNNNGSRIIAAKGAPEAILQHVHLTEKEVEQIQVALNELTSKGYRVLAVGAAEGVDILPERQDDFDFKFKGLVAFYDPPKNNIREVLANFYAAGIKVKIITGDNLQTTKTIAEQLQLQGFENTITGDALMTLPESELDAITRRTSIFARMFPDAKLKVIQSLKRQSEIVAMTGDGVNDGPALKAAHIGIAMGKKGSELAKQASALVLSDDNIAKMVDAIAMGRKIYSNLKKAIQYIISIHIPIILIVFLPLLLGWVYPAVFTPVHVIFLELIMGPTCSIAFENEPIELNAMQQKPRSYTTSFFSMRELLTSVIQGLAITGGLIFVYWFSVSRDKSLETTSALVFLSLITANVLLTLMNRSFYYPITTTLRYANRLIPLVIIITISIVTLLFTVAPLRLFFRFEIPSITEISLSIAVGFISVFWFEGYKAYRRNITLKKMN